MKLVCVCSRSGLVDDESEVYCCPCGDAAWFRHRGWVLVSTRTVHTMCPIEVGGCGKIHVFTSGTWMQMCSCHNQSWWREYGWQRANWSCREEAAENVPGTAARARAIRDAARALTPSESTLAAVEDNAPVTEVTKPTNPKDLLGSGRLPLDLVPPGLVFYAAQAFLEGALKYGRYNWRVAGVRASIYKAALSSHLEKWWNGQDTDPVTGVSELGSVAACVAILIDAWMCGKLEDDRPPRMPPGALDALRNGEVVGKLQALYGDRKPKQYTIADSEK